MKHGYGGTPIYQMWRNMLNRCYRADVQRYKNYGGRGIKVCAAWHDVHTFVKWATDNGYAPGLTLDRIDNDGDYAPGNCRFVSRKEQARNKTTSVHLTAFGETKTVAEWLDDPRCAVKEDQLRRRLKAGWSPEVAIGSAYYFNRKRVAAFGEVKYVDEWINDPRCRVNYHTLRMRIDRGWSPERAILTPMRRIKRQ